MTSGRVEGEGRWWLAVGLVLIGVATCLRTYRLDYGLPLNLDVDGYKWVDDAARMVRLGEWRPTNLQYPTFYTYVLAALYRLFGAGATFSQHLVARGVSAFFGVGMAALAWVLGRRIGGRFAAAVAACLVALSVVCVTASRAAATDTMTAFFATAALCFLVRRPVKVRDLLWAGALAGLAAGTKFSGAMALVPVWIAGLHAGWTTRGWLRAAAATGASTLASAAAFLAVTPAFIPLYRGYLDRISLEAVLQRSGQLGHVQLGWFDYLFSLTPTCEKPWQGTSLLADAGPVVLAAAGAALAMALSTRFGFACSLLALYCVAVLGVLSRPGHVKALRFLLPILPPLFALVGWLAAWSLDQLRRRFPHERVVSAAGAMALAALGAWPAAHVVPYASMHRRDSTNALARQWAGDHVPAQSRVMIWPLFEDDLLSLPCNFLTVENYGTRQYNLADARRYSPERQPVFYPDLIDQLRDAGVDYVIVNSCVAGQFDPTPENRRWFPVSVEQYARMMRRLEQTSDKLFDIRGWSERRPGPDITVYRLHAAPPRAQGRAAAPGAP